MLSGQLISPSLFGFTYAATVGTFPQAIFIVSAAALTCSLVLISFVRIPKSGPATVPRDDDEVGEESSITGNSVNCAVTKLGDDVAQED
jgi:hypothetical protein